MPVEMNMSGLSPEGAEVVRAYTAPVIEELRALVKTAPTSQLISTLANPCKEYIDSMTADLDPLTVSDEAWDLRLAAAILTVADEIDRRIPIPKAPPP